MANMNQYSGAIKGRNPLSTQCMPTFAENEVRDAAVWVEGSKYVPKKSFPSIAGAAPDNEAAGLNIKSDLQRLSAVVVHGDCWENSQYTVKDSKIELSGYGVSDFTSRGAGALIYGGGTLKLENTEITTRGSGRCATIATENGTLIANNCKLSSYGGELPPDYEKVIGPGMMEPPWPLGLSGNCRTHLSMDGSRSFFNNCDFYAAAWGAISTDSSGGCLYLEANDCRVEVAGNGYGTYADNGCHNVFNRCKFKSGNMLSIQDGNNSITLTDSEGDCEKNCFMIHGGLPEFVDISLLDITGGRFKAKENVIYAKSASTSIYVKGAVLESESGVILKSICNDDPIYYERACKGPECYGVQATFEAMDIKGDILHEDTDRKMRISLVDTALNGAVTGNPVLNFYGASKWLAAKDSAVTVETDTALDAIDAPAGVTVTVTATGDCKLTGSHTLPSGGKLEVK
jgi:hypothetical protein